MDAVQPLPPAQGVVETFLTMVGKEKMATVTLIAGLATVLWMWARRPRKPEQPEEEAEDEDEEPVHQDVPAEHMPAGGVFTAKTLAPLDGLKLPLCMGVCGKVVNCSASGSIRHGHGYGKLWAGRDATYSLATLSLKEEDASRRDFTLEDFTADQQKALAGWYKHFTTKYPVIGVMTEYEGWDFSAIEELAKEQTPFGLPKDSDAPASAAVPAEAEESARKTAQDEAAPSIPSDAQTFRKGDRVQLRDLVDSPDMNGAMGILEDYNQEKGRFVIRMQSSDTTMLFKPANLLIVKE